MLPMDNTKPIVYEKSNRAISPEQMITFFQLGFAPAERKMKMIFLVLATTGLRIGEVCAMNVKDFIPDSNFTKFRVKLQKRKTENFICIRVLPEAAAAILRTWIRDNWAWICSKEGHIFPHPNNRSYHTKPHTVEDWLGKKRKQLHAIFPKMGFLDITGYANYSKGRTNPFTGKVEELAPRYKFCPHSFRHFFALHISNSPEQAKNILRHLEMHTTLRYRNEHDLLAQEEKLSNSLFNSEFFDVVKSQNDKAVAVWDSLKQIETKSKEQE